MNRAKNRQMILTVIKKVKALEKGGAGSNQEKLIVPDISASMNLISWKLLRDIREGRIKHLDGKKLG